MPWLWKNAVLYHDNGEWRGVSGGGLDLIPVKGIESRKSVYISAIL